MTWEAPGIAIDPPNCRRRAGGVDSIRTGRGAAFGTFGELLQGVLPGDDLDFLVTFPIEEWSTATFRPLLTSHEVTVRPAHKHKSRRLVVLILRAFGIATGGVLELHSTLPEGKGLASSSADLVATARAVGHAYGLCFDGATIEALLRRVEPSDGVMYDGIVAFHHRQVRLRERLGTLPPMTIVAYDEGGEVDTVHFNQIPKPFDSSEKAEYLSLLDTLARAVATGDLSTVGQVATRSALMNLKLRPRPELSTLRRLCHEVAGYGIVATHSGTCLGILLSGDDPERAAKIQHVRAACRTLRGAVTVYRSLSAQRVDVTPPAAPHA